MGAFLILSGSGDATVDMRKDKKDDEVAGSNPFSRLDKTAVVQEAKIFNDTPINARKCTTILCKLLYLFQHGEVISTADATQTFFATTKLWQCKDPTVRRLVYLAIKELNNFADNVIIVTSSLMKDMTGREDLYRAASIRVLCLITEPSMLQSIERYMKQAIVDKVPSVASAALVSSLHLLKKNPEFVRRCANEVQEAVTSDNHMVQFHALALLYHIRSSDKLAITKLIQKFSKSYLRSPLALCYLIRIAAKLVEESDDSNDRTAYKFIESCLRHKNEIVVYEAASAVVGLPNITSGELASSVSCIQQFCSSPKPALRFAAVRTLNRISINYPDVVCVCNVDLENLITDQNRSIATLAITTLLKTGAETSVERLMKQISTFVSEISDEFKIVVIEAIRALCARYPRKHATMMSFLATMLRDEGGYEYKKSIVDTIVAIVEDNPEAKETGLSHLCEFIEDCEHATLATKVLHLLGREGPATPNPQRYIRFIYNRVILETTQVRGAAVTALAKFGAQCPELRQSVIVLLTRCLYDTDDEVRDRATFYLAVLRDGQNNVVADYILNALQVSIVGLERQAEQYLSAGDFVRPFDIKQVPAAAQPITVTETKQSALSAEPVAKKPEKTKESRQEIYAQQLAAIPSIASLGPLFKSSPRIELTEAETEYHVALIKHVFAEHVVLQFDCKNTLNDQLLTDVYVELENVEEAEAKIVETIPLEALPYSQLGSTYIILDDGGGSTSFPATLKFKVVDVDPISGEPESDESYDDSYVLEEVDIAIADFVVPTAKTTFGAAWDALGAENEVDETFALATMESLDEAITNILKFLSMAPCERSEKLTEKKSSHLLLLAGQFRGGYEVLARVRLAIDPSDNSVTMNIIVRSEDKTISEVIANTIA
uniref:Coatomer subunit gamma n=1 Tax=Panagrellus redivivus TaxID=6233 RepID=A0A7E4VWV5_PANRE